MIDIGASNGSWSKVAMEYFSDAEYFLIDASDEHIEGLKKFKKSHKNVDYIIAAAGEKDGEIYFDNSTLYGGKASKEALNENFKKINVRSVDSLAGEYDLEGPYLLKLDTHGFELPIFDGATEVLKHTNLIVVETYNFNITSESMLFHEMCAFLKEKGFRCIDISEPLFRQYDKSLWQFDLFFIPESRKEFEVNTYE